jgi:NAD-dependent dihydropyrimidine dehydrogenase PreA subunit
MSLVARPAPRVEVSAAACTGCNVCVEVCPTDVLRLDDRGKAFAAWLEDCQVCFLCEFDCPYEAIRVFPR